jgi:hypothetical protein
MNERQSQRFVGSHPQLSLFHVLPSLAARLPVAARPRSRRPSCPPNGGHARAIFGSATTAKAAMVATLLALACSACGDSPAEHFSLAATDLCLRQHGLATSTQAADLDYIAQDAGEGAIEAKLATNGVTLAFDRTPDDAGRTEGAYRAASTAFGASAKGILDRRGNVTLVWDNTPTGKEHAAIRGCLTSGPPSAGKSAVPKHRFAPPREQRLTREARGILADDRSACQRAERLGSPVV